MSAPSLQARVAAVLADSPDTDPAEIAAVLVDADDLGLRLDRAWESLSDDAQTLLRAHGRWVRWRPEAATLTQLPDARVALGRHALKAAGWLDQDGTLPLEIQGWCRARLGPTSEQMTRAADAAEAAFHQLRYAGLGDLERRARLELWERWAPTPEIAQWAAIAREEPLEQVCDRCRVWALIEQSRAENWRGWEQQAERTLREAERLASTPQERFFVAFLRVVRAPRDPSQTPGRLDALEALVAQEADRLFVNQARYFWAWELQEDALPHLERNIQLAQKLGFVHRQDQMRLLAVNFQWPDAQRMRAQAELLHSGPEGQPPRDQWNHHWAWTRIHLAEQDLAAAERHALKLVEIPESSTQEMGVPFTVLALARHARGDHAGCQEALRQSRRLGAGRFEERLRAWAQRTMAGGPYFPLPSSRVQPTPDFSPWVSQDGQRLQLAEHAPVVDLSRSPVATAILRSLIQGPHSTDALIDRVWPDDASSYESLKARLHSAVRMLRKKGVKLTFVDRQYRLTGLIIRP